MDENQKDLSGLALSLSAAHSSALAARMLILEQDCREIEHFLDGYSGIFYQHFGVFPADTRRTIRCLISEIMGRITREGRHKDESRGPNISRSINTEWGARANYRSKC